MDVFSRDELVDKPGIVGARWWQQSLAAAQADLPTRRSSLGTILAIAAVGLVGVGIVAAAKSSDDDDDEPIQELAKSSLEMQKALGWAFGAAGEPLVFDGITEKPFSRDTLAKLWSDLAPSREDLTPWSVRTLLQAPTAVPTQKSAGDPAPFVPLEQVLRPMHSAATDEAYAVGESLANLLHDVHDVGVVVDLEGPRSVAFAAGMADVFDVVFLLDNWPHPRGVVGSHEALAVAAYYQPRFDLARKGRLRRTPPPSPAFVLDARRLADYVDATDRFDNRWVAKMPGAGTLKKLGVRHVLYVTDRAQELDDLNDDFVAYERDGVDVRFVRPEQFTKKAPGSKPPPKPDAGVPVESAISYPEPSYCYGGELGSHEYFFVHYPYRAPFGAPYAPLRYKPVMPPWSARIVPRASNFSSGVKSPPAQKPVPSGFAVSKVVYGKSSGTLLGWTKSRTGTWNRASGSWGG